MTTLLIIGAVLVWFGLLWAAAEYLVRRIERAGTPVRRLEVERMDGTVEVYHPMAPARLRWIEREDLTAAGWCEDDSGRWRHPEHGVMWPAWHGWRGVGLDGREVGPCGTAMEVVERLTREAVCARP